MKLKYVSQYTDRHGKVRRYVRKGKAKQVPLLYKPSDPRFWAEYEAALEQVQKNSPPPLPRKWQESTDRLGNLGIYFAEAVGTGFVKIGYSRKIRTRLIDMQIACPTKLELIHVIKATQDREKIVHENYEAYRTHGEWFRIEGKLKRYLASKREQK